MYSSSMVLQIGESLPTPYVGTLLLVISVKRLSDPRWFQLVGLHHLPGDMELEQTMNLSP